MKQRLTLGIGTGNGREDKFVEFVEKKEIYSRFILPVLVCGSETEKIGEENAGYDIVRERERVSLTSEQRLKKIL